MLAVGILLLLLAGLLVLLCSAILRNLGLLAKALPDMERTTSNALSLLRSRLTLLAEKLPENLQPMAQHSLSALFESGMNFTDDAVRALPAAMTGFLGAVSGSALTVGTGVLSAFMISLRLPKMQKWLAQRFPPERPGGFPAAADPDPQRRWGLAPGAIGAAASDISHRQRRTTDFTDSLCPSVGRGRGAGGCPAGAGVRARYCCPGP